MVPEGCNVENYNPLSKFLKELQLIETLSIACLFFKQTINIRRVTGENLRSRYICLDANPVLRKDIFRNNICEYKFIIF